MFTVICCSGSGNTNEIEDGHQTVSREAAQSLQVLGPAVEPNCANVDLSKRKKKNRKPPSDKNALVVISKKLKKTPKKVRFMTK